PLAFALARVRVWAVRHRRPGPACWVVLRRPLEPDAEVKSYLSNAAADAPLETRALVTATRYRVEGYLGEGNSYLGTAQYEARAWSRWHHPMSMVALAHRFVTLTRRRLKKDSRADLGPGPALAPQRVGLPDVHGRGSAGPQGVPPAAEPDRSKSPHEVMASTTHQGAIQSAAVKLFVSRKEKGPGRGGRRLPPRPGPANNGRPDGVAGVRAGATSACRTHPVRVGGSQRQNHRNTQGQQSDNPAPGAGRVYALQPPCVVALRP